MSAHGMKNPNGGVPMGTSLNRFYPEKSSGSSTGNGSLTSVTRTKYRSPVDTLYSGFRIPTSNFVRV
jgi:hypothetical protein